MSFYGSVYYQATQAFAKILLKNSGISNANFYNGKLENNSIESASRNGAFYVDSGNYWIQIAPDVDGFSIWHNKPRDDDNLIFTQGFRVEESPLVTDKIVELNSGDYLEVPLFYIDEAGHMIPGKTESIYYRMPVLEIETDISSLKDRMDTNDKAIEKLKEDSNKALQGVEGNSDLIENTIKTMGESFGNLKGITTNADSMEKVIGNFQIIRNTEQEPNLTMTQYLMNKMTILDEVGSKLNTTIQNQENIYADLVKRVGALEDQVRALTS